MTEPKLAPICRNVPDDAALRTGIPYQPYQVSAHKLDELKPFRSDRELLYTASVFVIATNLFESVDQERLRETQRAEYGEYIGYILDSNAPISERETLKTTLYYSVQDGVLFKSYIPGHLRKRSTFRDQLVLPNALLD